MSKLIVTHINPDLDAIGAVWMLKRFLSEEYGEAAYGFVASGKTYKNQKVDSQEDVVHVDTGMGRFDHHDEERNHLSATMLVYEHIISKQAHLSKDKALKKMAEFVTEIDHFGEYFWPEKGHDRYAFMLSEIIPNLSLLSRYSNDEVVDMVLPMLDAVYKGLGDKIKAEEIIAQGREFESKWGKGIAIETGNDAAMKMAQKMGYEVVVRRDPINGFIRIKTAPKNEIDLKPIYDKIIQLDDPTKWYFHPSGNMLLNGSSKDNQTEASNLSVSQVVEMIVNLK